MVSVTACVDMMCPTAVLHTAFPPAAGLLHTVIVCHVAYQRTVKVRDKVAICQPTVCTNTLTTTTTTQQNI